MSTLDSNTGHHIAASDPITARMSAGEWWKVLGTIVSAAVACALYVASLQSALTDNARETREARADAKAALAQNAEIRADLNRALGDISGQLGYIRGQLERLTSEPRK